MKEEYSQDSMLRSGRPRDQLMISSIIEGTEKHIRAMCRVMQVYEHHACDSMLNVEDDYRDLVYVFSAFYDYVDGKMDILSELSRELEADLNWVSLEKLRKSEDFREKVLPRQAFVSEEAYSHYLARKCHDPAFRPDEIHSAGG